MATGWIRSLAQTLGLQNQDCNSQLHTDQMQMHMIGFVCAMPCDYVVHSYFTGAHFSKT